MALFPSGNWAEEKPHLSAPLAAELARDAGAGHLVLTHFNPRYDPEALLEEAREYYPTASLAELGGVYYI